MSTAGGSRMPAVARDLTEPVKIDASRLRKSQSDHAMDLSILHELLPDRFWPKVVPLAPEPGEQMWFYPGKVFIGTQIGAEIYACLLRKSSKVSKLEIMYSYDGGDDTELSHRCFPDSEFQAWCYLLTDIEKRIKLCLRATWETRLKLIVKLVLLEAGYYDGPISIIWPPLSSCIRQNFKKGLINSTVYKQLRSGKAPVEIVEHSDAGSGSFTTQLTTDQRDGRPPRKAGLRSLSGPEVASRYITTLKSVIPREHWFDVAPLEDHDCAELEKSSRGNQSFQMVTEKVLLGLQHGVDGNTVRVWAGIRKITNGNHTWTMIVFDDKNYGQLSLPTTISEGVDFEPVFKALYAETSSAFSWRTYVSNCVRLALIENAYMEATDFKLVPIATPKFLRKRIHDDLVTFSSSVTDKTTLLSGADDATLAISSNEPTKSASDLRSKSAIDPVPAISTIINSRKRKATGHDPLSLLKYLDSPATQQSNAYGAVPHEQQNNDHAEGNEQSLARIQELIDENTMLRDKVEGQGEFLDELHGQVDQLHHQKQILTERVHTLTEELASKEAELKQLQGLVEAHINHCQPIMVEILTRKHLESTGDKGFAKTDAALEYEEIFGLEVQKHGDTNEEG